MKGHLIISSFLFVCVFTSVSAVHAQPITKVTEAQAAQLLERSRTKPMTSGTESVKSAAPVVESEPAIGPNGPWVIRTEDQVLRRALTKWATAASMQMDWDVDRDHMIAASANFTGSFEQALGAALDGVKNSDLALRACIYKNGSTQVVRIVRATQLCQ
jgi:hypothetical protein